MEKQTLRSQTEAQVDKSRQGNPEFMNSVDEIIAAARAAESGGGAVGVGQQAPAFELPDARGSSVSLAGLCAKGPVVVTFYRGSWCPYCNLQLRALHETLPAIRALGAELVAISPQKPDDSLSVEQKEVMDFVVLSDQDAKVAARFGVAWEVPERILKHMREDRGLDLETINHGNGSILPIPATFVIDSNGVVVWRFVDVDYRTRSEPSEIVAALQSLAN